MNDSAKPAPSAKDDDFDTWREPLLASLRDCGTQPAPRYAILRYALAGLVMMITVGTGQLVAVGLRGAPAEIQLGGAAFLAIFGVAVLSRIRNYFLRQAWQAGARSAEDELKRLGSRRPILYLRSFALDKRLGRPTWMERYLGTRPFATTEQQLTASLKQVGPVIAIGRPGEKLPPLGAARFYVADDRWQEKVEDVERVAQLVVWATGVTDGLRWEIEHLVAHTRPRRLIIWAHPHLLGLSERKRELEWTRFRETLGSAFPKPLPEKLGSARFFIFDADWNPIPVAPKLDDAFSTKQYSALRTALLLQQNGSTEPERERLREIAAHREPTDLGSLIGARSGPIAWPLAGVLMLVLFVQPLVMSLVMRLAVWLRFVDFAVHPSLFWLALEAAVTTAALVAAFRHIRNSWLASLAAAAGITLALFILSFRWWPGEHQTWGTMFADRIVFPFVESFLLFACLAWTVRRWPRLAFALFGGYLIAAIAGLVLLHLEQTYFPMFDDGFSSYVSPLRRLVGQVPQALLFAGLYVGLLKLVPLVGLDERSTARLTPT